MAVCAGTAATPRMNGDANKREGGEVKAFSDAEHTPEAAVQNAPPPPHQGHNPAAMRRLGTHRFLPPISILIQTRHLTPDAGPSQSQVTDAPSSEIRSPNYCMLHGQQKSMTSRKISFQINIKLMCLNSDTSCRSNPLDAMPIPCQVFVHFVICIQMTYILTAK